MPCWIIIIFIKSWWYHYNYMHKQIMGKIHWWYLWYQWWIPSRQKTTQCVNMYPSQLCTYWMQCTYSSYGISSYYYCMQSQHIGFLTIFYPLLKCHRSQITFQYVSHWMCESTLLPIHNQPIRCATHKVQACRRQSTDSLVWLIDSAHLLGDKFEMKFLQSNSAWSKLS